MEEANLIPDIERLVKAQDDVELVKNVALVNGQSFNYRINAYEYGRSLGELICPPRPATLQVSTLTGFLDAIAAGALGGELQAREMIIHVEDYLTVSAKSAWCDVYGMRDTLLTAKHKPIDAFRFDSYYEDPARFIIGLQVAFLQTDELLGLIRIASNLKAGRSIAVEDDGFSQTVTLKAGEVSTAEVKVKPRIKLIPIRTFSEAAPVTGEFLVRFQQSREETPSIALFNVDGSKWQGETMRSIKTYLAKHLPEGTPILA
jgi:hypothetical protein